MNVRLLGLGSSPAGLMFLYKEEDIPGMQEARKDHPRMQRKTAVCRRRPRREASGETNTAGMLTSDFQSPEVSASTVLLFKPPSLWYFITAEGDLSSIPGLGISPGEENHNSLQYPCLGNPMDRGAWWATVYGVARVGYN